MRKLSKRVIKGFLRCPYFREGGMFEYYLQYPPASAALWLKYHWALTMFGLCVPNIAMATCGNSPCPKPLSKWRNLWSCKQRDCRSVSGSLAGRPGAATGCNRQTLVQMLWINDALFVSHGHGWMIRKVVRTKYTLRHIRVWPTQRLCMT